MAALTLARADAAWISAATLDRYLASIQQSPVKGAVVRDEFDATLIPDSLRKLLVGATPAEIEADSFLLKE